MTKLIPIVLISVLIFSCNPNSGKRLLPSVNGKSGEVLVVIENELWKDSVGETLKDILLELVPGLPQDEPYFDVSQMPNKGFTKVMQAGRNIIRVNIGAKFKKAIDFREDVWAAPQIVIRLQAPNKDVLHELVNENFQKIRNHLLDAELRRNLVRAKKYEAIEIERKVKSKFNVNMIIPQDYQLYAEKEKFMWLQKETRNYFMGLVIYEYNYTDTNTFTVDYLLHKRDSVLKRNLPGEREGSYMTTEHRVDPYFVNIKYKGREFSEIRSRWDLVKDAMGGPFISFSTLDKERNRVITVEGFVFYPNHNKRDLIRQLQAILLTLKIE